MKDIPHICVVCGVSVMKSVLARHMKIHDEIAQFRCEICDKRFIREKKSLINKVLRLEQEGEHLHQLLSAIEKSYKSVHNKAERYWLMLETYENKLYCTK